MGAGGGGRFWGAGLSSRWCRRCRGAPGGGAGLGGGRGAFLAPGGGHRGGPMSLVVRTPPWLPCKTGLPILGGSRWGILPTRVLRAAASASRGYGGHGGDAVWGCRRKTLPQPIWTPPLPAETPLEPLGAHPGCTPHARLCQTVRLFPCSLQCGGIPGIPRDLFWGARFPPRRPSAEDERGGLHHRGGLRRTRNRN